MRSDSRVVTKLAWGLLLGAVCFCEAAVAGPAEELDALLSACDPQRPSSMEQLALSLDRAGASAAATESGRRAFVVAALAKLTGPTPVEVQRLLVERLGWLGKYEAVRPLGKILGDSSADPRLREAARRALETIPMVTVKKALRDALPTASGSLRIGILRSLGIRRDALAVQYMLAAARDPDVEVRLAAIEAMALVGEISSVGVLEEALRQYKGTRLLRVRRAYLRLADSLVENSERGTARRIYDRAMNLGTAESCAALIGFARAGLQSEVQRIVRLTSSENAELRAAALEAAAMLPGPNMTKALQAALEEATDDTIRQGLERVLARRRAGATKS